MFPLVLMARKSTFEPGGTWKLPAQPYDCLVSERHSSEQSMRKPTFWMGWLPDTLACTHHSLPFTPVNVASKTAPVVEVELVVVVVAVPPQVTFVASAPEAGIQR